MRYGFAPGQTNIYRVEIDSQGYVTRFAGDNALPVPLGQLLTSLIQTFPVEATKGWEGDETVFILDEPLFQGPANAFLNSRFEPGYIPGRQGPPAILRAEQKVAIRVTDVTDD